MSIEQKSFQFIEKYCLKKMKKTSISKLLVYIQNNKNIVIHCSSHCSYKNSRIVVTQHEQNVCVLFQALFQFLATL